MVEKIHNCDKCPHCNGEGENGRSDCELYNGSFKEFMEKCPQMNSGGTRKSKKGGSRYEKN